LWKGTDVEAHDTAPAQKKRTLKGMLMMVVCCAAAESVAR
jgi:hypothetical protein